MMQSLKYGLTATVGYRVYIEQTCRGKLMKKLSELVTLNRICTLLCMARNFFRL